MFVNLRVVDGSFLSTLSLRRATNPVAASTSEVSISIHTLLAESDGQNLINGIRLIISIHTLLAESDDTPIKAYNIIKDFYPHSPCGERLEPPTSSNATTKFLSTLSLRRATMHALIFADLVLFLSTLSLRRATLATW